MVDGSANRISHREGNKASEIYTIFTSRPTSGSSEQSITTGGKG